MSATASEVSLSERSPPRKWDCYAYRLRHAQQQCTLVNTKLLIVSCTTTKMTSGSQERSLPHRLKN